MSYDLFWTVGQSQSQIVFFVPGKTHNICPLPQIVSHEFFGVLVRSPSQGLISQSEVTDVGLRFFEDDTGL